MQSRTTTSTPCNAAAFYIETTHLEVRSGRVVSSRSTMDEG